MNREETSNNSECGQVIAKSKTLRDIDDLIGYIMVVIDEAVGESNICGTLKIMLYE